MYDYNDNETVTMSLERYEELKRTQVPDGYMLVNKVKESESWRTMDKFLKEKGYVRVFRFEAEMPMRIISTADAIKEGIEL